MTRIIVALLLSFSASANAFDFRAAAIAGHMKFLASDLLEGRAAGTRGHDLAAAYVAAQFEAAGVRPGAGDSYLQQIRFVRTRADENSTITLQPDEGPALLLRYGDAFVTGGDPLHADRTTSGRIVVAGYGISAPELDHDDYAGIDARGKIVVVFSGAPRHFEGTMRAHHSSTVGKILNAAAHGAVGIITINSRGGDAVSRWDRVVGHSRSGTMTWMTPDGAAHVPSPALSSTTTWNPAAADTLFARSGRSFTDVVAALGDGTFRSFELPLSATIRVLSRHETVTSPNVVGLVRGSDPRLRDEYLVYSSHLDHVGVSADVEGDAINNGAFDNASGISALIEIGRAFAQAKPAPRRSILLVATTAEEKGLRGAEYFAHHPTVPAGSIVANINIDQVMMIDPVRDVIVYGIDESTLGNSARTVAARHNVVISEDPYPEQVVFVRSDQYPFIKRGIPALYIDAGYLALDPAVNARENRGNWMRTRYHTPADDLDQQLDFSVPAMVARFSFLTGLDVANQDERPRWNPGNFFGRTFGAGAGGR